MKSNNQQSKRGAAIITKRPSRNTIINKKISNNLLLKSQLEEANRKSKIANRKSKQNNKNPGKHVNREVLNKTTQEEETQTGQKFRTQAEKIEKKPRRKLPQRRTTNKMSRSFNRK